MLKIFQINLIIPALEKKWSSLSERHPSLKRFFEKYGHIFLNIYIFINVLIWTLFQGYKNYQTQSLNYIEIAFLVQNLVMGFFILVRHKYKKIDKSLVNQLIASFAFFSGIAFFGQPETLSPVLLNISKGVIFIANILGIITLFNLGQSFGILIAYRKLKTKALYSFVRHPMYGTDILLRIGFIISHFNWFTIIFFIISTLAYNYRAILEERLLTKETGYSEYMKKVRYRFIPLIY